MVEEVRGVHDELVDGPAPDLHCATVWRQLLQRRRDDATGELRRDGGGRGTRTPPKYTLEAVVVRSRICEYSGKNVGVEGKGVLDACYLGFAAFLFLFK